MFGIGLTTMMNSPLGQLGARAASGASGGVGLGTAAGGMGALLGPAGLALMGFGAAFNAIDAMKQAKKQKRDMQDQATELRRLVGVEQQTNLDMQIIERNAGEREAGHIISQGTKSGVSVAGSLSLTNFRNATLQNIEDRINFRSRRSVEKQTSMHLQANRIDRQARRVVKDAKWKAFSDILGGAADVGVGGYNMGLWGNKDV